MSPSLLLTEESPSRRRIIGGLRNLGLAASGAAATHRLISPPALVTPADASARLQHHLEGLKTAFKDLYSQGEITTWGHRRSEDYDQYFSAFLRGDLDGAHTVSMRTKPLDDSPLATLIRARGFVR